MALDRRRFLQSAGLAGAALVVPRLPAVADVPTGAPQTGFEARGGADWTTHEEELAFLKEVARRSTRVRVEVVGRTEQGRPLHLVSIGSPRPQGTGRPTAMFVGSQHGNEPAGRETSLSLLRDLAFTTDPVLVRQLSQQTVLVVPSANPDGRAANTRENSTGVDINRDHLTLQTAEARAISVVLRDLRPDVVLDLHEYGPSVPVLYDDEVLYLWARNLNVDAAVRDLSRTLAEEYIGKGARVAGFTADEYGLYKAGPQEVTQTAGDEDEGICRNAVGLRHSLGILVESAVTADPRNGPTEVVDGAALNLRRVASQTQVTRDTLRFLRDQGEVARYVSERAPRRKAEEGRRRSAPVYFGGADNRPPTEDEVLDPP
ncbi:MAG: carboxypeptidase, partial [Frankiales bacterium]